MSLGSPTVCRRQTLLHNSTAATGDRRTGMEDLVPYISLDILSAFPARKLSQI